MEEKQRPDPKDLIEVLEMLGVSGVSEVDIRAFTAEEDGAEYAVWHVKRGGDEFVLKRAKGMELEVYRCFFSEKKPYVPAFFGSAEYEGESYFLSEYSPGETLSRCDRTKLKKVLDALAAMQDEYWERGEYRSCGMTPERSMKGISIRGQFLGSERLERVYADFIRVYKEAPLTLCHDDLLPFNVLIGDRAVFIDWEYGGLLPYPVSFARLIAHCSEAEDAEFYMTREDREFAIEYYYKELIEKHGIPYERYRSDLDRFLFYEYTEWIMLGNRYDARGDGRYVRSLKLAEEMADKLLPGIGDQK